MVGFGAVPRAPTAGILVGAAAAAAAAAAANPHLQGRDTIDKP